MPYIDQFLSSFQFSERHSCLVAAKPAAVLDAVVNYRPGTDPLFKMLISLRELPMRLMRRKSDTPDPFGFHNFTPLGRTDDAVVETRVFCPDRTSQLKFTPYWLVIRPASGFIRRRMLSTIKKESERAA